VLSIDDDLLISCRDLNLAVLVWNSNKEVRRALSTTITAACC
jgi:hypothetical protein